MARGARGRLFEVDVVRQLREIRKRLRRGYRKPGGVTPRLTPALRAAKLDVWYLLALVGELQFAEQLRKEIEDGNQERK